MTPLMAAAILFMAVVREARCRPCYLHELVGQLLGEGELNNRVLDRQWFTKGT